MGPKFFAGGGPVPIQPEMLDLRASHQEIMRRLYSSQNDWVFERRTLKAVKVMNWRFLMRDEGIGYSLLLKGRTRRLPL